MELFNGKTGVLAEYSVLYIAVNINAIRKQTPNIHSSLELNPVVKQYIEAHKIYESISMVLVCIYSNHKGMRGNNWKKNYSRNKMPKIYHARY